MIFHPNYPPAGTYDKCVTIASYNPTLQEVDRWYGGSRQTGAKEMSEEKIVAPDEDIESRMLDPQSTPNKCS